MFQKFMRVWERVLIPSKQWRAAFCLLSAAKLGDTRELESFIDMLDRELAGAYLRELHPLSLNLFFIPFALKLTSQQAAVCNGGGDADRVHVCNALKNRVRSSHLVSIPFISEHLLCVNAMSGDSGGLSTRPLVIIAYFTT